MDKNMNNQIKQATTQKNQKAIETYDQEKNSGTV